MRDRGRFEDPLAGRRRPSGAQVGGYGLWLANQVCDLVQLRSHEDGSTVRVHMRTVLSRGSARNGAKDPGAADDGGR